MNFLEYLIFRWNCFIFELQLYYMRVFEPEKYAELEYEWSRMISTIHRLEETEDTI